MTGSGKQPPRGDTINMSQEAWDDIKEWGGHTKTWTGTKTSEGMSTSINPWEGTFSLQFAKMPDLAMPLTDGLEVCTAMMRAYTRNLDGVVVRQGSPIYAGALRINRPRRDRPIFLMDIYWRTGLSARISVPRDRFYQIALLAADLRGQIVKSVMES